MLYASPDINFKWLKITYTVIGICVQFEYKIYGNITQFRPIAQAIFFVWTVGVISALMDLTL